MLLLLLCNEVNRRGKTSGSNRVNRVAGWVGSRDKSSWPVFFKQVFFFFFEIDAICQLFLSSLIVIRFLLVILLPLTNYH